MRHFLLKVMLFFLGLIVIFSPPIIIGVMSGEIWQTDELIQYQTTYPDSLIGIAYTERTPYYKLTVANQRQAEVIALGTSRVMQFKSVYFKTDTFYNCGGAVNGNYLEYVNFLKNLDYKPHVVILGLDSWMFNDAYNSTVIDDNSYHDDIEDEKLNYIATSRMIIKDYLNGKYDFSDLVVSNNKGLNAIANNNGFMYDGSYYYGSIYVHPELQKDFGFADTYARIREGIDRFQWGDQVDADTLAQLNELLMYCDEQGIYVVGFTPPFAPSIYDKMEETGKYGYLSKIGNECSELFENYGYSYFDYADGETLGMMDRFYIDGFHGDDFIYAEITKDMIKHDVNLKKYVVLEELDSYKEIERVYSN